MQDTQEAGLVPGLGRSPGEGMATHSSNLAWRIPWTEETGGRELDTTERLTLPLSQQQQYRAVSETRWIPHMNGVYFWMRVFGKFFL